MPSAGPRHTVRVPSTLRAATFEYTGTSTVYQPWSKARAAHKLGYLPMRDVRSFVTAEPQPRRYGRAYA